MSSSLAGKRELPVNNKVATCIQYAYPTFSMMKCRLLQINSTNTALTKEPIYHTIYENIILCSPKYQFPLNQIKGALY